MKNQTLRLQFCFQITITILFFVFLSIFFSFNKKPQLRHALDEKSTFPIILDTLSVPTSFRTRTWVTTASYNILYLGYEKDSLFLQHNTSVYTKNIQAHDTARRHKMYHEAKIQLEIDVSQEVKENAAIDFDELILFIQDTSNLIKYYKAYPVLIKNQEKKPIIIGHTGGEGEIPLLLEAKDQDGLWKPIEEAYTSYCGFGVHPIILKPQEIIVTAVKIYQGTFKTQLRLKYGTIYSKIIQGSINPSQFKNQYEEACLKINQKNNIKN